MTGRSVKATYLAHTAGEVRPVKGQCFGVIDTESSTLVLTCEDANKGIYPLNLKNPEL